MSNTFNLRRFSRLFRKTIMERPIQIFGIVFLNLIIVMILYMLLRTIIGWNGAQNLTFIWGFIIGGCFLSSSVFNYFSSNANGSSYLTLPASQFEKWLCAILISWVLYVIIFLLFYKTMDKAFVVIYHSHLDPQNPDYKRLFETVQPFSLRGHVAMNTYVMFANFSGAMFVGSLYFNKISFIKTSLLICGALVGAYGLNLLMVNMLFDNVKDAFPFSNVIIDLGKTPAQSQIMETVIPRIEEGQIDLPGSYGKLHRVFIQYILPLVLCISAYIRLREKEF